MITLTNPKFWIFQFFLIPLWVCSQNLEGSTYPLRPILDNLQAKHGVYFSYDSDLIQGISIKNHCKKESLDLSLACISSHSILNFDATKDSNYVVIPEIPDKPFQLNIKANDGVAIFGVQVYKNKKLITTSNFEGLVEIPKGYSINDTVTFKSFGFAEQIYLMKNLLGQVKDLIVLELSTMELGTVVIRNYTADGVSMLAGEHGLEIKVNELSLLPGETDGDIFMSLQNLPGITTVDGRAGNLYIRGGTPDQNLILFDEIPIYHTGHYFGTISPYNPKMVDKMDVYRTGFSPENGGRIGSVVDIKSRTELADSSEYYAALNTLYGSASIVVPISKKLSLHVAARSSYPSHWVSPKLEQINNMLFNNTKIGIAQDEDLITRTEYNFHFHDLNAKLIADVSSKDKLLVSFVNIDNTLAFKLVDDLFAKDDLTGSSFLNNGLSVQWNREISDRILLKSVVTGSNFQYEFYNNSFKQSDNSINWVYTGGNEIIDYSAKIQTDIKIKKNILKTGIEVKNTTVSYNTRSEFIDRESSFFFANDASFINSFFANYDLRKKKLILNLGGRASYYSQTQETFFEPRVFASYKLNKRIVLKGSSGVYAQYLSHINNIEFSYGTGTGNAWKIADGTEAKIAKSFQNMIGASFSKNDFVVDLEIYNKEQRNLTYYDNNYETDGNNYHEMTGRTFGFDVLLKKKWDKFSSWASYTYNKSTYWIANSDSINSTPSSAYFEQPHTLSLVGLYETGPFRFSLGWTVKSGIISGYKATPGGMLFSPQPRLRPVPGLSFENEGSDPEITDRRFPMQHQLDLSISWKYVPKTKKFIGHVGLSILNLYNQANITGQVLRPSPLRDTFFNRYSLGFSPNLQVSINW